MACLFLFTRVLKQLDASLPSAEQGHVTNECMLALQAAEDESL